MNGNLLHWKYRTWILSLLQCLVPQSRPILPLVGPQVFPEAAGDMDAGLSSGAFISCSADNTIRLWHIDEQTQTCSQNILSSVSFALLYVCF